jgi:hypothetical protein
VQAEVRDDYVKGCVGKRHLSRRLADESAAIGDALKFEVMRGCLLRVPCKVFCGPDIDSGGVTACIKAFSSARKEETTTAAHIEDMLISGPGVKREHKVAMAEFANLDVEEIETSFSEQKKRRPEKHRTCSDGDRSNVDARRKKKAEDQTKEAEEKKISKNRWGIDPIVGLRGSHICGGGHE